MNNENAVDLKTFNLACDEFVAGKYILAENKIATILKSITANEKIKNLVVSCVDAFNFDATFKAIMQDIDEEYAIEIPNAEKEIVAFVFGLLYRFDTKQLNFYSFISKYFKDAEAGAGQEFYNFGISIILPFRDAVNSLYAKRHVIITTDDYQTNYYNQLKSKIKEILHNIDEYHLKMSEREEFTMLLNSLYIASDKNDKKLVYSLMIGLEYFVRVHKRCRIVYADLQDCFG